MAYTIGQKELKTDYPFTSGLTAGSTKQAWRKPYLSAEQGSKVLSRDTVGIR